MRKKKKNRLIEQRDEIRVALAEAFADNKFEEYDRLYDRFIKLDKKIRKGKE